MSHLDTSHAFNSVSECHLLITFANSMNPDQARQNVLPDLCPNCLTLWLYSWKNISKKLILKKKSADNKKAWKNYPACKAVTLKAPITTAADDKFWDIFPNFRKNRVWYFMRIVCWQTILMKYHALFVNFEKSGKILNCRLLQSIGGALRVKYLHYEILPQIRLLYVSS